MLKTFLLKQLFAVSAVITASIPGAPDAAEIYPECGHVVYVNEGGPMNDDAVVIRINDHFYPALADDLEINDFVALIMDTNGTDNVNDDSVIAINYIGRP